MLYIPVTVLVFALMTACVSGISIDKGKYEDVNIVIQDTVVENDTLLKRIQDVFTSASQLLFEATRHHVYFGQINIILPKSWTAKPEYTAMKARSELESYITVEAGKMISPHTKRREKKCGHAGRYMYLHADFLLEEGRTKWGHHENVLVHEWGHLRWGLFDEYPLEKNKRFYLEDGVWHPTRCSKKVKGIVGMGQQCSASTSCTVTDTTEVMNKDCQFCPHETQSQSNLSSIMAYNWVDGITMFCDKEDDETIPIHQKHNSKAPNQQNDKCKGRSAWEVMRDHIDFKSEPLPAVTDTTPVFNIVRETDGYRVFVLDISGSMDTNERIDKLYQASKYVIQKKIPDNSWLGIIWFNDQANVKMKLTHVVSQEVRDHLVSSLPKMANGGTCIGCGIEKALEIFRLVSTDLSGSEIIVISDGNDNGGSLDSAVEHAINEKCVIHTISISQAADERMISMATRTGGIHISYLETETINFASVFMGVVSKGVTQAAMESTTLISETVDTLGPSPYTFTFDVDNSVGKNTTVSVLNKVSGSININVESPNGTLYSQQANGDSLVLCIPGIAEPGRYNATIEAESTFEHIVTSEPTGPEVVRVDSWISPVNFDFVSGNLPVVGADVSKGRSAVLNANVTAIIGTGVSVPLFDNGLDPDDLANDGAYAGVIPRYCIQNNGRLTAKVIAHAEGGTASIKDSFGFSAGYQYSDEDLEEPEVLKDSFQRVSLHNEILVSNFSPVIAKTDITPPGRITDVDVIDITTEKTNYGESRNFTITWTATGNDVNIGQAANYELRIADDIYTLINNFSAATMLDTVNTNYTPKAAGETEYIRIEIDAEESYTSTTFFALRAKDEAGNLGDVSNIVSILVANGYRIQAEGDVEKPNRTNKVFQFNADEEPVEGKLEEEEEEEEEHVERKLEEEEEEEEEPVEGKLEEEEEEEEGGEEEEKEEEKTTKLNMLGIGLSCAAVVIVIVIIVVAVIRDKKRKQNFEITRSPEVRYSEQLQV